MVFQRDNRARLLCGQLRVAVVACWEPSERRLACPCLRGPLSLMAAPAPRPGLAPPSPGRLRLRVPGLAAPVGVAFGHTALAPGLVGLSLGLLCPISLCSAVALWEMGWKWD